MKRLFTTSALFIMLIMCVSAQEVKKLPEPDLKLKVSLTEAMQKRRSNRDYSSDKQITDQQLSLILWAACGVNDAGKGLLTIPTAINAQDIKVYVCTANGVSIYEPKENALKSVTTHAIRPELAAMQSAMAKAPVFLLIVSDQSKFRGNAEVYGAMDAGYASQDICLMCAALGLKTVPRAIMNKEAVAKALSLPESTILELNHPIGY